jgi:hypothetical protein
LITFLKYLRETQCSQGAGDWVFENKNSGRVVKEKGN